MTEEQLNNTEDPLGFDPPYTLEQAIQAINRLLWSDGVEDDDQADAEVVKSFLVNDNMQEIAQKKMYKDRVSKTIPVMETTIEGAQKRIEPIIEWYDDYADGNPWGTDLEYIAVFLDTVGDEMAAITSSCNSLHDRYVEAVAEIAEWKDNFERLCEENKALHKANLNNLHAADDNR